MDCVSHSSSSSLELQRTVVCSMVQSVVTEVALLAQSSFLLLRIMKISQPDDLDLIANWIATDKRFPFSEINRQEKPTDKNKDAGESDTDEDDDEDDNDDQEDDGSSGEEGSNDDVDSDAEDNGEGESSSDDSDEDEDEDDDEDDDDDDDDEDEEEDDEDDNDDGEGEVRKAEPPSKKQK